MMEQYQAPKYFKDRSKYILFELIGVYQPIKISRCAYVFDYNVIYLRYTSLVDAEKIFLALLKKRLPGRIRL